MSAKLGYGSRFYREDSPGAGTYTTPIANVLDITGPGLTRADVDASHMASPNGHKEVIAGLVDPGEVSFDLAFVESDPTQNALRDDLMAGPADPKNYRVAFPAGQTWTFAGIVTGFEITAPIEDRMTASVSIKISGKPTVA